jgi:hypothetical protein
MAVTGLLLSVSLAATLARKGAAVSLMFEPGVNTWPGAGLVTGAPAGGPLFTWLDDVRAAPAACTGAAAALPEASSAPASRPDAATALASDHGRGRSLVIFDLLEGQSGWLRVLAISQTGKSLHTWAQHKLGALREKETSS